jgi:hypothetical protein
MVLSPCQGREGDVGLAPAARKPYGPVVPLGLDGSALHTSRAGSTEEARGATTTDGAVAQAHTEQILPKGWWDPVFREGVRETGGGQLERGAPQLSLNVF